MRIKRMVAMLLTVCFATTLLPAAFFVQATASVGASALCTHHPVHTAACGYMAATKGKPCKHLLANGRYSCAVIPAFGETAAPNAVVGCDHGDGCGFVAAVAARPCLFNPASCALCHPTGSAASSATAGTTQKTPTSRTSAATTLGDFTVSTVKGTYDWDVTSKVLKINTEGDYAIGMKTGVKTTANRIEVTAPAGDTVTLVLADIIINASATKGAAFAVTGGCDTVIQFDPDSGKNISFTGGKNDAGVQLNTAAGELLIQGDADSTLTATGGDGGGAGINGSAAATGSKATSGSADASATITLNGGKLVATGQGGGAGISDNCTVYLKADAGKQVPRSVLLNGKKLLGANADGTDKTESYYNNKTGKIKTKSGLEAVAIQAANDTYTVTLSGTNVSFHAENAKGAVANSPATVADGDSYTVYVQPEDGAAMPTGVLVNRTTVKGVDSDAPDGETYYNKATGKLHLASVTLDTTIEAGSVLHTVSLAGTDGAAFYTDAELKKLAQSTAKVADGDSYTVYVASSADAATLTSMFVNGVEVEGATTDGSDKETYFNKATGKIYVRSVKADTVIKNGAQDLFVKDGTGKVYRPKKNAYTLKTGSYIISGATDIEHIIVDASEGDVDITLDGATIDVVGKDYSAFFVSGTDSTTITLADDSANTLKSSGKYAGLQNEASPLTIQCANSGAAGHSCTATCGSLNADGGAASGVGIGGAGIGGGGNPDGAGGDGGNVTINGGRVIATSVTGAGIGDGAGGGKEKGGTGDGITINGGVVIANSTDGAGIGGAAGDSDGSGGAGNNITINGGTIIAASINGAGIGGGVGGGSGADNKILGGSVKANGQLAAAQGLPTGANTCYTYTFADMVGKSITGFTNNGGTAFQNADGTAYGDQDIVTDVNGKIYLWNTDKEQAGSTAQCEGGKWISDDAGNMVNTIAQYSVVYDTNGGAGTVPATAKYSGAETVTVLFSPLPVRSAFTFLGWGTASAATVPTYTQDGKSSFDIAHDTTLYAVWEMVAALYSISGTITDGGGVGIPATLQLKDGTKNVGAPVVAAANGDYRIIGVPLGNDYTIDVTYGGYDAGTIARFAISSDVVGKTLALEKPMAPSVTIQLNANGGSVVSSLMNTTNGALTPLPIPKRSGYSFAGWFTATTGGTQITADTVFVQNGTIYAQWIDGKGGSSSAGGGNNAGAGANAGVSSATDAKTSSVANGSAASSSSTAQAEKPTLPIKAPLEAAGKVSAKGVLSAAAVDTDVTDAIKKAQDTAKKDGTEKNGIDVTLTITSDKEASALAVSLPKQTVDALVAARVNSFTAQSGAANIALDLAALKEIEKTIDGDAELTVMPVDVKTLSKSSQTVTGKRPAMEIAVTGADKPMEDLGSGKAVVSIPYTLQPNEDMGTLMAFYLDAEENAISIRDSGYDKNTQSFIFTTSQLTTYGVGFRDPIPQFVDTKEHFAKDAIDFALTRKLLAGTTESTFSPDAAISRGTLVTALGTMARIDTGKYKTGEFNDVEDDAKYAPYVYWAASEKIMGGKTEKTFAPEQFVTRQEMAEILDRFTKLMGYSPLKNREQILFADSADIASDAAGAVKTTQMAGIMVGENGDRFSPTSNITRAETAALLQRYIMLIISESTAQGLAQNDNGKTMFYENGTRFVGTKNIGGKTYRFGADGVLLEETT